MKGFTIVELLVVLGVVLLLAAVASPIYGNLQNTSQVGAEADQLVQALRVTREKSIAGLGGMTHGVFFEANTVNPDRYLLYRGLSYATRDQSFDRVVILPSVIDLAATLAGAEINFAGASGTPSATGEIFLTHQTFGARRITINESGLVNLDL